MQVSAHRPLEGRRAHAGLITILAALPSGSFFSPLILGWVLKSFNLLGSSHFLLAPLMDTTLPTCGVGGSTFRFFFWFCLLVLG